MRMWRERVGREEWRKGGRMTWIFKPKRQNVADKKSERNKDWNRNGGDKIELELELECSLCLTLASPPFRVADRASVASFREII